MYKCLKCGNEFKYESKFNIHKNKKKARTVKLTIDEKIEEYKKYRNQETLLHNGYSPDINNSKI